MEGISAIPGTVFLYQILFVSLRIATWRADDLISHEYKGGRGGEKKMINIGR